MLTCFDKRHNLNYLPEDVTDASLVNEVLKFLFITATDSDRSQSQTKGESEGHFHGNLGHRVMEAHVELLRNGLQQHASESRRKETEMRNSIYLIYIVPNRNSSRLKD